MQVKIFFILIAFFCSFPLRATDWNDTLIKAKGQTVYMHTWGGYQEVNQYLRWAANEIEKRYNVTLVQVKVSDISTSIQKVLSDKKVNHNTNGSIDLMWINGENFSFMKNNKLLGRPFTKDIPNMRLVDSTLPIDNDFTIPTEGLEAPWGIGQFTFMVNTTRIKEFPNTASKLLTWAKRNPGRFTYPKPPEFHGTSFLKQMLFELTPNKKVLYKSVNKKDFDRLTAPLWQWLDQIHPYLWRRGHVFPSGTSEIRQLIDDQEIDIGVTFNPEEARSAVLVGDLPPSVKSMSMSQGALTNTHFLAIPFNASSREGAEVIVNFLLSPEAQSRKADPNFWGDPTVLKSELLKDSNPPPIRFKPIAELDPSWQNLLESEWDGRYSR